MVLLISGSCKKPGDYWCFFHLFLAKHHSEDLEFMGFFVMNFRMNFFETKASSKCYNYVTPEEVFKSKGS